MHGLTISCNDDRVRVLELRIKERNMAATSKKILAVCGQGEILMQTCTIGDAAHADWAASTRGREGVHVELARAKSV